MGNLGLSIDFAGYWGFFAIGVSPRKRFGSPYLGDLGSEGVGKGDCIETAIATALASVEAMLFYDGQAMGIFADARKRWGF